MTTPGPQTVLITGSTDGIGRITAAKFARTGARLLVHGRDEDKCRRVARDIRRDSGNDEVAFYCRDLASLAEVGRLADEVAAGQARLDVLINNAGVGLAREMQEARPLSGDGFELCFAVNYLAPFLLTRHLLPLLRESAPARIVNVASVAQKPLDFADPMLEQNYDAYQAYAQSKLALIMFTFDLAEELQGTGVTVNCLHPGTLLDTNMVRQSSYQPQGSAESGAEAVFALAADAALAGRTGCYFDVKEERRAHGQAYDLEARKRLRRLSEELVK